LRKSTFHGLDDLGQGLLQGIQNLFTVQGERTGHAFGQITTTNVDLTHLQTFVSTADFVLDALGGGIADQAAVVTAHVGDDGFVEFVTTHPNRVGVDDAVQGDDGNFSGTAADVDNHGTAGFFYRQAGTDGRCHGLFNEEYFTSSGAQGGLTNGLAFNLGRLAGHAHQNPRARGNEAVFVNFVNKVLEHFFSDDEVSDHAIFHRADGGDVPGRAAEHAFRFGAHGRDHFLGATGAYGNNGGFVQHDAATTYVNQCVGGAQINGQVA